MTSIDSSFCKYELNKKTRTQLLGRRRNDALWLMNDKCAFQHFLGECRFNGAIVFFLVHAFIAMTYKLSQCHYSFSSRYLYLFIAVLIS